MKKSTLFEAPDSGLQTSESKKEKKLPTSPKKESVNNVLAFARAYSVRKSKSMEHIDIVLN